MSGWGSLDPCAQARKARRVLLARRNVPANEIPREDIRIFMDEVARGIIDQDGNRLTSWVSRRRPAEDPQQNQNSGVPLEDHPFEAVVTETFSHNGDTGHSKFNTLKSPQPSKSERETGYQNTMWFLSVAKNLTAHSHQQPYLSGRDILTRKI